ncbi:hypothetical protein AB0F88_23520 [Streptosporangium sp. NPDC023963]|uniref:hypothetical protein n=1 Tax=Streptosporangium sp. NPDC023963 TaxID=3155608 RepID=UPI0034369075
MARLGVHRDFFRTFLKLEKSVQDQTIEVFSKFRQATHTGLHLEPVAKARDPRTHRMLLHDSSTRSATFPLSTVTARRSPR